MKARHEMDDQCSKCGSLLEWECCDRCWGEGDYDLYEDDPINECPGTFALCPECKGDGGFWVCTNAECWTESEASDE